MLSDRGQRASKDHNPRNEQTFDFIPTPMVSREARSSSLKSGLASATCTQSVLSDVPIDDVNLDDVVDDLNEKGDAKSACVRASGARKQRRAEKSTTAGRDV